MTLRFSCCPCCEKNQFKKKKNYDFTSPNSPIDFFYGGWKDIEDMVTCLNCGFKFINTLVPEHELFYVNFGDDNQGYSDGGVQREQFFRSLKKSLKTSDGIDIDSFDTALDVGAGDGEFLLNLGMQTKKYAIEPSQKLTANLQSNGITCFNKVSDLPSDLKFQLITLNDVLEHVENPTVFLDQVTRHLEGNGILLISVPDYSRLAARILGTKYYLTTPMHFSYFTWQSMKALLSNRKDIQPVSIRKAPLMRARLSDALKWFDINPSHKLTQLLDKVPIGYRSNFISVSRKNNG